MGANARGNVYVAVDATLVVLSTIVVAIRVAARAAKSTLGWDDYVICLSIVLAYSMLGEAIFCTVPISLPSYSRLIIHRGPRWRTRKTHERAKQCRESYLPKGKYQGEPKWPIRSNINRSLSSQTKFHTPFLSPP